MAGYSARAKRCHTNVPDPLMAHMILIPLHNANLAAERHHYCFSLLYRTSGDFDIGGCTFRWYTYSTSAIVVITNLADVGGQVQVGCPRRLTFVQLFNRVDENFDDPSNHTGCGHTKAIPLLMIGYR